MTQSLIILPRLVVGAALAPSAHPPSRPSSVRRDDVAIWDRVILPMVALVGPLTSWILAGLIFRFGWLGGLPVVGPGISDFALDVVSGTHSRFRAFVR